MEVVRTKSERGEGRDFAPKYRAPIQPHVRPRPNPTKRSSCRCFRCTSCLFDDCGYCIRPRYIYCVTARNLVDRRPRTLGHETLRRRRNHLVLGYEQVPTRFGLPSRFTDRACQRLNAPRHLRVCHERGLFRLHVSRERRGELRLIKEEITVLWWQDRRHRCVWRRILNETVHRLTFVRRKRGDIDEPRDFRIVAGLGDYCSTV